MNSKSIILKTATNHLFPALIILSVVILYRGHNLPGGGFIGGLFAATAFIMLAIGFDVVYSRKRLYFHPISYMIAGLFIALISGLIPIVSGNSFMKGMWMSAFHLPILGTVHLGTPLLFDIGVYLTVLGFTTLSILTLMEDRE